MKTLSLKIWCGSKLLIVAATLLFSSNVFSQSNNGWEVVSDEAGIIISKKLTRCVDVQEGFDSDYYLLKLENTSAKRVSVSWQNEKWYNGNCATCNSSENLGREYTLQPKEVLQGGCKMIDDNQLRVYVKHNNVETNTKLSDFKITDLEITSKTQY